MAKEPDRSKWVSPDRYSEWAETGRKYTKMMLKGGPANQGFHPVSFVRVGWSRLFLTDVPENSPTSSGVAEAAQVYDYALKIETGNCTEHASVAFTYLYRLGIRPLVMLGYSKGRLQDNHMVLAVGLDVSRPNFTVGDMRKTDAASKYAASDQSWICDPWKNITYRAIEKFWDHEPQATGKLEMQAYAI